MDEHYLSPYLQEALPKLDLDCETYGPYITGLFPENGSEEDDEEDIEEQLNNIMELLQSSSETHSDNESCWKELKNEILQRKTCYADEQLKKSLAEKEHTKQMAEEKLKASIQNVSEEMEICQSQTKNKKNDEQINDLMNRYGYDEDDDQQQPSNSEDGDHLKMEPKSNREFAAEAKKQHRDFTKAECNKTHLSKKAAQEATSKQRLEKTMKKEERRKKAVKGERKR